MVSSIHSQPTCFATFSSVLPIARPRAPSMGSQKIGRDWPLRPEEIKEMNSGDPVGRPNGVDPQLSPSAITSADARCCCCEPPTHYGRNGYPRAGWSVHDCSWMCATVRVYICMCIDAAAKSFLSGAPSHTPRLGGRAYPPPLKMPNELSIL